MTTLEILKAARELLAVPERWTKGVSARRADGMEVNPVDSVDATCFCMTGAVQHVSKQYYSPSYVWREAGYFIHIPSWNDAPERTHAEVLARFDEAIAKLEEKVC